MAQFTVHSPQGKPITVEAPSQEAALDQVLGATGPDVSSIGSFGRGAVGMLPLGDQAYAGAAGLLEHKPYLQERNELKQEIEADKDTNPGARLAGQAAGVIAPIALTGGLAAPETLLGAAGQGAAVGGLYGAGNAIDTLAGGGSGAKAAGDVALGAGIGAAGGAAGKGLTDLLSKVLRPAAGGLEREAAAEGSALPSGGSAVPATEAAAAPPTLDSFINARGQTLPSEAPSGAVVMGAVPEAGSEAHIPPGGPNPLIPPSVPTEGLPGNGYSENLASPAASDSELRARQAVQMWGGTPRQVRKLPGKDLVQTVNHLADVAERNSTPENNLFALTDRYNDRLHKYVALQDKAGKIIGDTIKSADVAPMPVQPLAEKLSAALQFPTPDQEAQLSSLGKQFSKWSDGEGVISFPRLQQLKTSLGKEAFAGKGDPVLQAAYHIVDDAQDTELEKLSTIVNKPAFTQAKEAYQMTSRVIPMLRMGASKSLTGRPSLTELLSGHPIAALQKLGGERLEGLKNAIGFKAANALSKGDLGGSIPAVSGAQAAKALPETMAATDVHLQHPAMAPWREMFSRNASRAQDPGEIAKANAVTDFTLSQRDPAYAAAKQKAIESPEMGQEAPKMAEGGIVQALTDTKPVEGFGSTLEGLEKAAKGETSPSVPAQEPPTEPAPQFHQPFNPQFEEQLRKFLMQSKDKANED